MTKPQTSASLAWNAAPSPASSALLPRCDSDWYWASGPATVPEDQAPATITADSPIYPLALMDATKHPQIHGHATNLPDRRTDRPRADEGDASHAYDPPGDDEPDADPREGRQPRHERTPRDLAETPEGSGQ